LALAFQYVLVVEIRYICYVPFHQRSGCQFTSLRMRHASLTYTCVHERDTYTFASAVSWFQSF